MRIWTRMHGDGLCGANPEHVLRQGDPIQIITKQGQLWKLIRCALCANGLPPPDLPPFVPANRTKKVTASVRGLARDFKLRQAGE